MKKAFAVLCALIFALSAFCACSGDEKEQGKSESSASSGESALSKGEKESEAESETKGEKASDEATKKDESTTEAKKEKTAFPAFEAEDVFGGKTTNKIFSKNEITLVNVFSTDYERCEEDMKILAALSSELKNVGFLGIAVDVREGDGTNEKALRRAKNLSVDSNAEYPYLMTDKALADFCSKVYIIPTTYFVDKDGNIVGDPAVGSKTELEWKQTVELKIEQSKES